MATSSLLSSDFCQHPTPNSLCTFRPARQSEARLAAARRAEAAAAEALSVLLRHHDDLLDDLQQRLA